MKPVPSRRLRVREIVFAVAMGGLAAGGAALILEAEEGSSGNPAPTVAAPDELTYNLAPFEEISSAGPQDVIVTLGDTFNVRKEGPSEALALIDATVDDGKLVIRQKAPFEDGASWSPRDFSQGMRRLSSVTFHVTVPRLSAFALIGSGDAEIDRVEGERFDASVRGSGELSIGSMQVEAAEFSLAGSGSVEAAGTAGDTRITLTGSGEVDASDLRSATAWVSMAGSGEASLRVEQEAQVSIKGSGDVDISGPARCTVTRAGSGDVRCSGS